ncbi:MAG: type II CRISPR RNA-guided endonuclease Cas9 [Mycoplasmatales bacterium]
MSKDMNFTVGYDIGIASVGWAIMNNEDNSLVDMGVRKFDEANPASEARINRSARRTLRRKKWRKNQLKKAFYDFNIIDKETLELRGYNSYTATHKHNDLDETLEELNSKKDGSVNSIYHIRQEGLTNKLSKREIYLSILNIIKTRGHFLIENVDFTKESIPFELFVENFFDAIQEYVVIINKEKFCEEVLLAMFTQKVSSNTLKKTIKEGNFTNIETDELSVKKLEAICLVMNNNKGNLNIVIGESDDISKTDSADTLRARGVSNELCVKLIDMYDLIQTSKILEEYDYICQKNSREMDELQKFGDISQATVEGIDGYKKGIQEKMSLDSKKYPNKLRVVKNMHNNYPNGLYQKEIIQILNTQVQFYPEITQEFIKVCCQICSARIPYYMGPLSTDAKNSWIVKHSSNQVKYSYDYSKENFDESTSVANWKMAMISKCTYLHEEYALPRSSFFNELFAILNEINILTAVDKNDNTYYLKYEDKIKILNELFLKKKEVSFKEVSELLDLSYFGPVNSERHKKFNKNFSIYNDIKNIVPSLEISNIEDEIKINFDKIKIIDELIMSLNLYDDYSNKRDVFVTFDFLTSDQADRLAKLNTKDFGSLSFKFIADYPINEKGESILEVLLSDNTDEFKNEQMTIISKACDKEGKPINLSANKYDAKFIKINKLGMHLLIENNKPFLPISRPVIRSLNEVMKVHNAIIKEYGVPNRVVIETARDLGDFNTVKKVPAKHYDDQKKLYINLKEQIGNKKFDLVEFEQLNDLLKTKKKFVELYIRQNGRCMMTGEIININHPENYQIDHILPRGFGDNSMNNSMLITSLANQQKSNRLPIEYIREEKPIYEKIYIEDVNNLFEMKLISQEKKERLLLKSQEDAFGFIERNLVDTRYIIKEFTSILMSYSRFNNHETRYSMLQGGFNSIFRSSLRFHKSRAIGDQHHAHDAAIIIVIDKCLEEIYPNFSSGNKFNSNRYSNFIKKLNFDKKANKNNLTIQAMYQKAFNHPYDYNDGFLGQVKEVIPAFSQKANYNYKGEFFNATIYPQDKVNITQKELQVFAKKFNCDVEEVYDHISYDEILASKKETKSPLEIIGVNNNKQIFSSINCAAVDFYKITDKKGKKKHFAIHIPKVIINEDGMINEEMYKKLIIEHYGYNELVVDNVLQTFYFRIRVFNNDLIYDTHHNEIKKFVCGSIVNKKVEYKNIFIQNYNYTANISNEFVDYFNLKEKNSLKQFNIDNIKKIPDFIFKVIIEEKYPKIRLDSIYSSLFNEEIDYLKDNLELYEIDNKILLTIIDEYERISLNKSSICKYVISNNFKNDIKEVSTFEIIDSVMNLIYNLSINNYYIVPPIIGQIMKGVSGINKYENAQYSKIVPSLLGIKNINEKPTGIHKKVKKEKFSWNIINNVL